MHTKSMLDLQLSNHLSDVLLLSASLFNPDITSFFWLQINVSLINYDCYLMNLGVFSSSIKFVDLDPPELNFVVHYLKRFGTPGWHWQQFFKTCWLLSFRTLKIKISIHIIICLSERRRESTILDIEPFIIHSFGTS